MPYLSGERTPIHDPMARGVFFGLNLTHTRGNPFRPALESISAATRQIAEAGAAPTRVIAVGGGTKMSPWLQATSDMTGLPQELRRVTLGAAHDNALLAALTLGVAQAEDIDIWNPPERTVEPRDVPAYAKSYPLFRRLYEQTKDLMHELSA